MSELSTNRNGRTGRRPATRAAACAAGAVALAGALVGCSTGDSDSGGGNGPHIVASTNVYGAIAEAVAGDAGSVDSIIDDPTADPHSFEATPADAARIAGADLIVYNGAGYDSFVDQARENAPDVPAILGVDAFEEATGTVVEQHDHSDHDHSDHDHSADGTDAGGTDAHADDAHGDGAEADGHDHSHAEDDAEGTTSNEHVWYSLPAVTTVAKDIAAKLSEIAPDHAADYAANAAAFDDRIGTLETELAAAGEGRHVHFAQTEPIGGHLFDALDAHDVTPAGFTSSIEEGADPSAADFAAMRGIAGGREIALLVVNPQTETTATREIADAARGAGTPVVELTETVPADTDVVDWMSANVHAIADAIGAGAAADTATPAPTTTARG